MGKFNFALSVFGSMSSFSGIIELIQQFSNERHAQQYLARQRWPGGAVSCPYEGCRHHSCYAFKDGLRYKCKKCRRLFTVKTGTFMEASKLPSLKWIVAGYLLLHKKGISSVQLGRDIRVTQKTAWFMLQRIRFAMSHQRGSGPVKGTVEMDETFVGGRNANRHFKKKMKYISRRNQRTWPDKVPVWGMYHLESASIRAQVLHRLAFVHIKKAVTRNLQPGAALITDDWPGYRRLDALYERQVVSHSKGNYLNEQGATTNHIENFWSHFKRGLKGIYIRVSTRHLNGYVQEFAFRYNHRNFTHQQQLGAMIGHMECRLRYKDLTANEKGKKAKAA